MHLIGHRDDDPPAEAELDTGRVDHIAFSAENLKLMKERLAANRVKFDERVLPRLNMTQLFFQDPDGISIEFNFPPAETV